MAQGVILAAGFGTRLLPLTSELPKPIVPVGDRPLLAHIAEACRAAGLSELVANVHHQHEKISDFISIYSLNIQVQPETGIRGTAGGVAGVRHLLGPGAALVWNGDILTEPPVRALLALSTSRDAQVLAVSPRPVGEGTVGLDELGDVVRLRGRVFGREVSGGDYVGVMALGPGVLEALPERGCLFGDVALPHLARGGRVHTVPSLESWQDVGDLRAYVQANFQWLERRAAGAASSSRGWVSLRATVAPSVLVEQSLIGEGASVGGRGTVRRVIAWPGAQVTAPLEDAVVLTSGRVVPFSAAN